MKHSRLFLAVLGWALGLWIVSHGAARASAGQDLIRATPKPGAERRAVHPETGRLSFLGFDPGEGPTVSRGQSALAQGEAFLGRYAAEFGLRDPDRELRVMESRGGERGRVRYQQVYAGVPVVGGELIVNFRGDGELSSINGEVSPDISLDTSPQVSAQTARATALEAVAKYQGVETTELRAEVPELWIYDERLLLPSERLAELVWRTEVRSRGDAPIRELVLINAVTGGIALHFNQVDTSWGGAVERGVRGPLQQDTETPTGTGSPTETETPTNTETPTPSPTVEPTTTLTSTSPPSGPLPALYWDMILDPGRNRIYASNFGAGILDVFSLVDLTWIHSVDLGASSEPAGIDLTQDGDELAVALSGVGAIAFIDLEDLTVSATVIPTGASGLNRPWDVLYGVPGSLYSVSNPSYAGTDYVHVFDTLTDSQVGLSSVAVRFNPRLGITADRQTLYVNEGGRPHGLQRFDVSTDTPQQIGSTDGTPQGLEIAVLPDGSRVFTSGPQAWAGSLGPGPLWAGGNSGEHLEYIDDLEMVAWSLGGNRIHFVDAQSYAGITVLTLSSQASVFRASADGTRLIVSTSMGLVDVDLVNFPPTPTATGSSTPTRTSTNTSTPTATLTPMPVITGTAEPPPSVYFDMVIDDARGLVYASNPSEDSIDVYAIEGLEWVTSLYFGEDPRGIDISPDGQELAVALEGTGTLAVLDLDTYMVVANVWPYVPFWSSSKPYDVLYGKPGRLYSVGNSASGGGAYVNVFDTADYTEIARTSSAGYNHRPRLSMTGDKETLYVTEASPSYSSNKIFRFDVASDTPALLSQTSAEEAQSAIAVLPDGSKVLWSRGKAWSGDLSTVLGTWAQKGAEIEYLPVQNAVAISYSNMISFIDVNDYHEVLYYAVFPIPGVSRVTADGLLLVVSTSRGITAIDLSPWPTLPFPTSWPPTPTKTPTASPTLNPTPFSGSRRTFSADGTYNLPGRFLCDQTQNPCTGGYVDADRVHQYTADTLAFYATYYGRDGLDDARMVVDSTVGWGEQEYYNSFWNGYQTVYGRSFSWADDIVGHEITHGVTQFESNLFYYYQSGAINESFSDLWGEFVDQTNGLGNDSAAVKWEIGEDINEGVGPLRSMSNPPAYDDPDKMTSVNYYTGASDNGGVHTNSGINNKAAFLLTDGGSFNGLTISALGLTKVAAIYYEVQTGLLTSGADYGDLYNALIQGCVNLMGGPEGIVLADCMEVAEAVYAVQMNQQPVAGFNTDAAFCPTAGKYPVYRFLDDLESGSGAWNAGALVGSSRWFYGSPYGPYAHSGESFLYADDYPDSITDTYVEMVNPVTVPTGGYLHFDHAYGFEDDPGYIWDGGVLEFSMDGGAWIDAGPLIQVNGYDGTIYSGAGSNNPLAGRQAFGRDSHGYISSRVNLGSMAGHQVRFRWRMGLDSGVYDWGWWIDDVAIYNCVTPTFNDVPPDHWAFNSIELIYQDGLTAGCSASPPRYCPETTMYRSESAVFVERGIHGSGFVPPVPSTQTFEDVPFTHWSVAWVDSLWQDGYTAGCSASPLRYCPDNQHNRVEGAVFYERMLSGNSYSPPPPVGIFADVPISSWEAQWAEAAYADDLIEPCQTTPELLFCPHDPLSRALAAYMMVQAKQLLWP